MRVWVTRTRPQAEETAERLRGLGHEPAVAPVLQVRPVADADIDLAGVAALALTSRNGVAAFAELSPRRDLPVFVTGEATAAEARAADFSEVQAAEGDVDSLARLILSARPAGAVLHARAREPAGDLVGALAAGGLTARSVVVYETVETGVAPPGGIEAVLIHSPRAARAVAAALNGRAEGIDAFAISEAAAAPLAGANFRRVAAAPYPSEAALLKLLVR